MCKHCSQNSGTSLGMNFVLIETGFNSADRGELDHLPAAVIAAGIILVIIGILLARKTEPPKPEQPSAQ